MQKYLLMALVLVLPVFVSAHVTVKPNEVGVGAWQTFNVSVPVEKDIATVGVRLIIPAGLEYVTPNVKPGWKVDTVKMGEGEEAMVHEIKWTGGSIPAGMRDDFFFSAHVPAEEGILQWKAYQTYADGSIVSWDINEADQPKDASGEEDFSSKGPYSETKIINDLAKEETPVVAAPTEKEGMDRMKDGRGFGDLTLGASVIALILSAYAVYMVRRRPSAALPR